MLKRIIVGALLAESALILPIGPQSHLAHACWLKVPLPQLVNEADLIVVGEITNTNARITLGKGDERRRYVVATLTVREAPKGSSVQSVRLVYPTDEPVPGEDDSASSSADITYHKGMDGIWILRRDKRHDYFWADHPDDFQRLQARRAVDEAIRVARSR